MSTNVISNTSHYFGHCKNQVLILLVFYNCTLPSQAITCVHCSPHPISGLCTIFHMQFHDLSTYLKQSRVSFLMPMDFVPTACVSIYKYTYLKPFSLESHMIYLNIYYSTFCIYRHIVCCCIIYQAQPVSPPPRGWSTQAPGAKHQCFYLMKLLRHKKCISYTGH